MLTDPIADMLTRLRNALEARKEFFTVPYSRVKEDILRVVAECGFVKSVKVEGEGKTKILIVSLLPEKHGLNIKRVSKPGQRIYRKKSEIFKVKSGLGIAILSTPQGIMEANKARKSGVGGEVICEIW